MDEARITPEEFLMKDTLVDRDREDTGQEGASAGVRE